MVLCLFDSFHLKLWRHS